MWRSIGGGSILRSSALDFLNVGEILEATGGLFAENEIGLSEEMDGDFAIATCRENIGISEFPPGISSTSSHVWMFRVGRG